MEIKPSHKFSRETLEQLLAGISFFKTIKAESIQQFELLLQTLRVISCNPGEIVLKRGDVDHWLYFLLKGKLAVYVDGFGQGKPVNFITPGEVFGDLSRLIRQPRTATLVACTESRQSLVLAMDCSAFDDLSTGHPITLRTKLVYYRNTVHNLRWKLEVYRAQNLQHKLANCHRQVRLFHGTKETKEELLSLYEQAQALTLLLLEWNNEFGAPALLPAISASNSTGSTSHEI